MLRLSYDFLSVPVFIMFSVLIFRAGGMMAQEYSSYSIEWISEYPNPDFSEEKKFGEKISHILFGRKDDALLKPFGVCALNKNKFWVLDQGRGTIFKVENNKRKIPEVLLKEHISYPSLAGICLTREGNILFTDSRLNKVFILTSDGKKNRELNTGLNLQQPTGIAWSQKNKQIWIVETKAHRITVTDSNGNVIKRIGKRGTGKAEFNYPTFIWIDDNGDVYIVDSMNFRLQILDSEGNYISSFGKIGDASGYFSRPKGVAVDTHGNIYVADALYHTVQIYDKKGDFLYYFGSQGHDKGRFWMPGGLFIDKDNDIFVADTYNARIQIFKLKGR
ncbi:MAG: 6-bladed beta-propeller [Chlorobi bacterium]|nr:6-bladed beta-propeller [Chlorobiota bacterium]